MKINKRLLFICIAIPLIVGITASLLTRNSMEIFAFVNKPPLAPPSGLFPIVWTILYILMGISSYLIIVADVNKTAKEKALRLYTYQLLVNFLWPTFFFNFQWYFFSFVWLLLLWILVLLMILQFKKIRPLAGYLNVPYFLWLTFAGYLNFLIWILNHK